MRGRLNISRALRIPNIFIAGFQKCATTTLFEVLRSHPEIGSISKDNEQAPWPLPKEPAFFGDNFYRGIEWYTGLYGDCTEPNLIDSTPNYAANSEWLKRIANASPDAKIILSFRDPIKRALSAWNHWKQLPKHEQWEGFLDPSGSFESNVRAELRMRNLAGQHFRLVGTGYYYEQVEKIMQSFPRDQIHTTSAEWLDESFDEELYKIQKFLGLDIVSFDETRSHQRQYMIAPMNVETEKLLRKEYRNHDASLKQFLGRNLPWS